jgi:hypothetical protein
MGGEGVRNQMEKLASVILKEGKADETAELMLFRLRDAQKLLIDLRKRVRWTVLWEWIL